MDSTVLGVGLPGLPAQGPAQRNVAGDLLLLGSLTEGSALGLMRGKLIL